MRQPSHRKITKFFIVNPITDRRLETRFDSREEVLIRVQRTGQTFPGCALEIGKNGLKLESFNLLKPGVDLQIIFPKTTDQIRCFGKVVWGRKLEKTQDFEFGIAIESWYGIVSGNGSWKQLKGFRKKKERRQKPR